MRPRDECTTRAPEPVAAIRRTGAYRPLAPLTPVDLRLDGNEGAAPARAVVQAATRLDPELLRRYPSASALEADLARRFALAPEQVLVTAGADEALDRICRTYVAGRELVLPVPTFEMLERYAAACGARVREVPWTRRAFPRAQVLRAASPRAAIAIVSPNNPTGLVATASDLRALARARPASLLLVDLAYAEFADEDLTAATLELPNALVTRTFSKAFGLAGLRVGYVLGPERLVRWLRSSSPFPVSGPSVALAAARLRAGGRDVRAYVRRVRREGAALVSTLRRMGARAERSQANFVLGRFRDAAFVRDGLAGLGIAVRTWHGRAHLQDAVRITLPGEAPAFARLTRALGVVLAPQALLFDLDGVLADVSRSYRRAIVATGRTFGVEIALGEIADAKDAGGANDDWELTRRLVARRGVRAHRDDVVRRFQTLYLGTNGTPGLRASESLLLSRRELAALARRLPLALVTGRPRADAERFLREQAIAPFFTAVVTREDAPLKPDPAPVRLALRRLGVERAWMLGDTPDDVRAARAAGVLPIGVVPPGEARERIGPVLLRAGAARVLDETAAVREILPMSAANPMSGANP